MTVQPMASAALAAAARKGITMAGSNRTITIDEDFQGGLTLSASAVKNGLLAAMELGLVSRLDATEILLLIREATEQLLRTMEP